MASPIQITAARPERVRRLRLAGLIDAAAVGDLPARIWAADGRDAEAIVLDLTAATSIEPQALATLFRLKDLFGRRLRLELRPGGEGEIGVSRASRPARRPSARAGAPA